MMEEYRDFAKQMCLYAGIVFSIILATMYYAYQIGKVEGMKHEANPPGQIYMQPDTERQI